MIILFSMACLGVLLAGDKPFPLLSSDCVLENPESLIIEEPDLRYAFSHRGQILKPVVLGSGSFGIVYKARYDNKPAALKKMKLNYHNINEINNHLKIRDVWGTPEVYACGQKDGHLYLVEQLLFKDLTYRSALSIIRGKTFKERLNLYIGIMETVYTIHLNGLIHHDIKPENIMIENEEAKRLFLVDFGMLRPIEYVLNGGTQSFYSPKLCKPGHGPANMSDDTYALLLSIAAIEFGHRVVLSEDYIKGIEHGLYEIDHSLFISNIRDALQKNKRPLIEFCATQAVDIFEQVLISGLAYKEKERANMGSLILTIYEALNHCNDFQALERQKNQHRTNIPTPNFGTITNKYVDQQKWPEENVGDDFFGEEQSGNGEAAGKRVDTIGKENAQRHSESDFKPLTAWNGAAPNIKGESASPAGGPQIFERKKLQDLEWSAPKTDNGELQDEIDISVVNGKPERDAPDVQLTKTPNGGVRTSKASRPSQDSGSKISLQKPPIDQTRNLLSRKQRPEPRIRKSHDENIIPPILRPKFQRITI